MGAVWQDLRYVLRRTSRAPLLTLTVILALTAGIGLNAAIFTMIDGNWFKPRAENDPGSFVQVFAGYDSKAARFGSISVADYLAFRAQARSLTNLAAWDTIQATLDGHDEHFVPLLVTCNFFSLYGLEQAKLGRLFLPQECATSGSAPVAIMSEELWRHRYGADPNIVGRVINLNQYPFTIIGIAPADFPGRLRSGIWIPYTMQPEFYRGEDYFQKSASPWLVVEGRLKPGYSRSAARNDLELIASRQDRLYPGRKTSVILTNGSAIEAPEERPMGFLIVPMVMGPMLLLLLVACANVATLLLARAAARRGEIAIRLALGAGRKRLLRMLLLEVMVPTALAASISVYLAYEVPYALLRYMAPLDPHYPMRPDWLVVGFLMAVTLLASLVAGLAPARESLNVDLGAALKGQQSGLTARSRTHRILAVGQIAMSFALVAGAVMFVRQRSNIISVDPGFETEHVLIAPLDIDVPPYTADSAWSLYHTLEQRVLQLPGVRTVSYASATPFEDPGADEIRLPGQAKGRGLQGSMDFVSPKFFDTLGISIIRGRAFENSDVPARGLAQVAVVSQTLARVLWNDEDPIGKVVEISDGRQLFVLGVARNTKSEQFGALDRPRLYLLQSPQSFGGPLFVRFDGDPESLAAAIHSTVKSLDANQMFVPRTLRSKMDDAAAIIGRLAKMVVFVASVALMLSLMGVYGVFAFSMSQRRRELALRMALGASKEQIIGSVLATGAKQVAVGLLLGLMFALPAAYGWSRFLAGSPFQANAFDFGTYGVAVMLLTVVALAAMYIPVWRAAKVDPMVALRYE
jgi:predicted permease